MSPHSHLIKFNPDTIDRNGFVSVKDAARLASLSKETVYQKIQSREIRAYRLGKRVVIKAGDFLQWIDLNARPV